MGFLDRLFGSDGDEPGEAPPRRTERPARRRLTPDERVVERYRYLLRTAPPETIEQVHAEAFAKLSDEQRATIYEDLSHGAGTGERPLSSEPATLARAAARAEMRDPGRLESTLGGGSGFGTVLTGSLLGTVAGYVVGSALVSAFLPWDAAYDQASGAAGADTAASSTGAGDAGDSLGDVGADVDFG